MKKCLFVLAALVVALPFFALSPKALAAVVVDKEFVPGYNSKTPADPGLPFFTAACTKFTPAKASYASYFDLAVKNDRGADYPIRASIRLAAADPNVPQSQIFKYYIQTTFNNYAMGTDKPMSRFTAEDGQGTTLTAGAVHYLCVEQLWDDNATGWFYSSGVSGGYSLLGYGHDIMTYMDGSTFGYRTYANESAAPADTGTTGTSTTGTASTTSSSSVKSGSGPSSNISSAIAKPTNLLASYSADAKAVVVSWKASTTTTIGGYNLYRTETAGKDYKKIADTGKTIVTFNDTAVTAGKTYYYMVRAYKDTAESASSDEVSVTIPADAAVAEKSVTTTSETTVPTTPWYKNIVVWGLVAVALLAALLLFLIVMRRRKSAKEKSAQV